MSLPIDSPSSIDGCLAPAGYVVARSLGFGFSRMSASVVWRCGFAGKALRLSAFGVRSAGCRSLSLTLRWLPPWRLRWCRRSRGRAWCVWWWSCRGSGRVSPSRFSSTLTGGTALLVKSFNGLLAASLIVGVLESFDLDGLSGCLVLQSMLVALNAAFYLTLVGVLAGIIRFYVLRRDASCDGMMASRPLDLLRYGGLCPGGIGRLVAGLGAQRRWVRCRLSGCRIAYAEDC